MDILSCILIVIATVFAGRKHWLCWAFYLANIGVCTIINIRYHLWAYHFLNAGLAVMYIRNARKWRRSCDACGLDES